MGNTFYINLGTSKRYCIRNLLVLMFLQHNDLLMVNYRYFTVRIEAIFLTFFLDFSDGAIKQKINHSQNRITQINYNVYISKWMQDYLIILYLRHRK
jgi:hypothetical protein